MKKKPINNNSLIKHNNLIGLLNKNGINRISKESLVSIEDDIGSYLNKLAKVLREEMIVNGSKILKKEHVKNSLLILNKDKKQYWEI